jgi:hypothetical protein
MKAKDGIAEQNLFTKQEQLWIQERKKRFSKN